MRDVYLTHSNSEPYFVTRFITCRDFYHAAAVRGDNAAYPNRRDFVSTLIFPSPIFHQQGGTGKRRAEIPPTVLEKVLRTVPKVLTGSGRVKRRIPRTRTMPRKRTCGTTTGASAILLTAPTFHYRKRKLVRCRSIFVHSLRGISKVKTKSPRAQNHASMLLLYVRLSHL